MNKKQRSISTFALALSLLIANTLLPRGGGGGRGGGFRGGGGTRSFSGGNRNGFKGASSRSSSTKASSAKASRNRNNDRHGNTNNVNINNGSGGYGSVAPAIATGAVISTAGALSAAHSTQAENRHTNQASQPANTTNRNIKQRRDTDRNNNSNMNTLAAPSDRVSAMAATKNARPIRSTDPQQVNRLVAQHTQDHPAPAHGTTSINNLPSRLDVDGHQAYGFYHNGRCYATWFEGGVPYYWYGGLWTPWIGFWNLYPWWYEEYYTPGDDGVSQYEMDQNKTN